MVQQSYSHQKENSILWQIREGMVVYDWDDKKVGTVNYVQFPAGTADGDNYRTAGLDHVPQDFKARLVREGYIQVAGGLFSPDRYIVPGQVLEVNDKQIILNVLKTELIQL